MPTQRVYDDAGQDPREAQGEAELEGYPDEPIERLWFFGLRRLEARDRLAAAEAELHAAIVTADQAGVPRLVIAREARTTRSTVYKVLERAKVSE